MPLYFVYFKKTLVIFLSILPEYTNIYMILQPCVSLSAELCLLCVSCLLCHGRIKYCFKCGPKNNLKLKKKRIVSPTKKQKTKKKPQQPALVSTTTKHKNVCIVYLFKHLRYTENVAK